ncbi:MAG: hypothetical protein PHU47_00715 [Candidatus ainarchaeum sp.]|nr:hypothetical protein [Candidatus ainarchaeum sp.]
MRRPRPMKIKNSGSRQPSVGGFIKDKYAKLKDVISKRKERSQERKVQKKFSKFDKLREIQTTQLGKTIQVTEREKLDSLLKKQVALSNEIKRLNERKKDIAAMESAGGKGRTRKFTAEEMELLKKRHAAVYERVVSESNRIRFLIELNAQEKLVRNLSEKEIAIHTDIINSLMSKYRKKKINGFELNQIMTQISKKLTNTNDLVTVLKQIKKVY